MMRAERVVLDTDILISAALTGGTPHKAFRWVVNHGILVMSKPIFEELASRFAKSKFDRYISQARRDEILDELAAVSEWIEIEENVRISRDPSDDKFLETALAGRASYLVSGARDLLVLGSFRDTRIMTAVEFLKSAESR